MVIYLKLFLTACFWGGTFIAGRVIAKEVTPFSAAFLRFAVATFFLFLLLWKIEGRIPKLTKTQVIPVILLGMTGVFAYNVFFFKGLKLIDAGRAALIIATNPILISLLSSFFFKERLNTKQLIGILISVTGAIVVISRGHLSLIWKGGIGWGEFYIFCCVLSWVSFSIIGKIVLSDMSPLISVCWASLIGAVALFIPACLEGITQYITDYSLTDWISIVYLGLFGTVIGFIWYYQGIKAIGPSRASQFINFVPISAIIFAFFMLHEPVTVSLLIGAVMVISGVRLSASRMKPEPA